MRASASIAQSFRRPGPGWVATLLGSAVLVFICLFPFLWMGLSSIKQLNELYTIPPQWWPDHPTLANYYKVLFESRIPRYFLNSIVISVGSTGLALILAVFAANGFARFRFRGQSFWQACILVGQLLPTAAIIVPLFITLKVLGLVNTYWGLILVYMIITLPLSVWMLTSYFKAIPLELEEAAIIDGASPWTIAWRVFAPVMAPALVSTGLLAFVAAWNEFLFALTFTLTPDQRTVPVAIALMSGASAYELPWGQIMAASVIVSVPIVALALVFQRRIVAGLTAGAVR